jgi:hypothetical protein
LSAAAALFASFEETLRAADAALATAAARGLAGERRLALAGESVRIRFAGPRLAEILDPAFGHLARCAPPAAGAAGDDLTLTMIDGGLFGAPPIVARHYFGYGEGLEFAPPGEPGAAPALCADYGDGALAILDFARRRAVHWVADVARIPAWAAASPFRTLLGLFLAGRGRYLLHGAAIGTPAGAVLLAAKGGSGKSTCALACLDAPARPGAPPLSVAGDDFVVLEPDPRAPRVHSLLGTVKIGRAQAALFPGLAGLVARGGGPLDDPAEKAVLRLFPDAAERLALVLPLRAIAVPTLDLAREESRLEPLSRAEAMLALAPSSIFLVRGAGKETLDALAALVARLPCWRLRVGRDVRAIPRAIEALLGRVGEALPAAEPSRA